MSVIESTKPGAFISLAAAAEILGVSVHTLRRRIAAGKLPAFPQRTSDHSSPGERCRAASPLRDPGRWRVVRRQTAQTRSYASSDTSPAGPAPSIAISDEVIVISLNPASARNWLTNLAEPPRMSVSVGMSSSLA